MTWLADMAAEISPPWLKGPVGSRLVYALTMPLDALTALCFQGVKARFPLVGTPTALGAVGRDRGLRRGPNESAAAFAARCLSWLDAWKHAGSSYALLDQLAGFFSPNAPLMRVVSSNGASAIWYTRNADGSRALHVETPTNFNWDGAGASKRTRFFVIVYDVAGNPYNLGGEWGDGSRAWGDGGTIGTSALPIDSDGFVGVLDDWTAAHAVSIFAIFAFAPASFSPTTPANTTGMPDGTWGTWSKVVGGVAVPARLTTARYWEIT
jgi:hypothetical protein